MKRTLFALTLVLLTFATMGGVWLWWVKSIPSGGGIGSVSVGISEGVVVMIGSVALVPIILAVRALRRRYRRRPNPRPS